ncbi:MAG: hypothetical protein ABI599_10930 [Flavobacteriales bacterium]
MRSYYALPFLLLATSAKAQIVTTVQDGPWTSPSTWSCGCVPAAPSSLVIMHNVGVFGSLVLDEPQVQVASTGSINMSFPDMVLISTAFIMQGHVFFQGTVTMAGLVDVSGLFEVTGMLVNNGQLTLSGGSMIIEGDLLNNQQISGNGSICVYLFTNNVGAINGAVDICDFSPTTTTPPILDANTGTVAGTVTYCTNSACGLSGVDNAAELSHILVSPNPAVDQAVVELPGQGIVRGELVSMDGRVMEAGILSTGDRLLIQHPGANGIFLLRLFGPAGQRLGTVRLAFTGR